MARFPYRPETYERIRIRDLTTGAAPIPYPTERTPQEEIEALNAAIADECETIRAYASHSQIVAISQALIKDMENEREEWQAAIYAAEQEAFDRLMRATEVYPMFLEARAKFIKLIEERKAVQS